MEEVGGGFDLTSPPPLKYSDEIFPSSVAGEWHVRRAVTSVEVDRGQAELAWRVLGGGGGFGSSADADAFAGKRSETYRTKFVVATNGPGCAYEFDGKTLTGIVCDRGYETSSRLNQRREEPLVASWEISNPNRVAYGPVVLDVVQRSTAEINEMGFGSNELFRATTPLGGLTPGKVVRAVRVRRKFRRSFDPEGNRVIEGLEIVNTYRVLDGIAGVEMTTSTTKSVLRLTQ